MYASIFHCGWNIHFPTVTEKVFWRLAGVQTFGYVFPCCSGFRYIAVTSFGRGKYSRRDIAWSEKILDHLWRTMKLKPLTPTTYTTEMEDITSEQPWLVYLSTTTLAFYTVVSAFYYLRRGYILVKDVIGLRELPNSTFETVAWTGYLPRI